MNRFLAENAHPSRDQLLRMNNHEALLDARTKIKGVELQEWAQPLLADLLMLGGDTVCPQLLNKHSCIGNTGLVSFYSGPASIF
jgi:hypothetical protein